MSTIDSLHTVIHEELKDLYDAEKRLTKAIPKLIKASTNQDLIDGLEAHLAETENHVARLEQAFGMIGETPKAKPCAGIKGVIEEASEHLGEDYDSDVLKDIAVIAAGQRAEHYEMAAYGNVIAHAKAAGLSAMADLLSETLEEEKAADEKLTEVGGPLNAEAASAREDDREEPETRGRANTGASGRRQRR